MTGPVTTEAPAERKPTRRTLIQAQARRHYEHVCRLHEMIRTLEAAHQQATAERDEARTEVERLRSVLNFEKRASRVATSELARLRAEGEAKDRLIALLMGSLVPFVEISVAVKSVGDWKQALAGARTAFRAARAATAREG